MAEQINPSWMKTLIFSKYSKSKNKFCLKCESETLTTAEIKSTHSGEDHTVLQIYKRGKFYAFHINDIERIRNDGFHLDTEGIAGHPAHQSDVYYVKSDRKYDQYKSSTECQRCRTCGRISENGIFCSILCKLMQAGIDPKQRAAFVKELRLSEKSEKDDSKNLPEGSGRKKKPTNKGKKRIQDLGDDNQLCEAKKLKIGCDGDGDGGELNKGKKPAATAVLDESGTMKDLNQVYVPESEISYLERAEAEKKMEALMELENLKEKNKSGDDGEKKGESSDVIEVYVPESENSSLERAEAEKETTPLMELQKLEEKNKSADDVEKKGESSDKNLQSSSSVAAVNYSNVNSFRRRSRKGIPFRSPMK